MKTFNTSSKFTVAVNEINKNRALLPFILHDRMSTYASSSIHSYQKQLCSEPELFKINMLKNAYLNDVLKLKSRIVLLNTVELHLLVEVYRKTKTGNDLICKAYYKTELKVNNMDKAS